MNKDYYHKELDNIMKRYNLDGTFLHSTYDKAIDEEDFNCCYIDIRVKNSNKVRKELAVMLDDYFNDYQTAKLPLYSYK
jgi:phosphomannomutase